MFLSEINWNDGGWKIIESISGTVALVFVASEYFSRKRQNQRHNRIDERELYNQFTERFNSDECILFTTCLLENPPNIFYVFENDTPYLEYRDDDGFLQDLPINCLDAIQDLYIDYSDGLISGDLIIQGFGAIILLCHNNLTVRIFIEQLRITRDQHGFYDGIDNFLNELDLD